jgi:hypothetical protein
VVKARNLYKYPPPYIEIAFMLLIIAFNVINFLLMGGIKMDSIINIERCTTEFWVLFGFQIGGNYILYTFVFGVQKFRHDAEYLRVKDMIKQKQ